MRLRSHLQREDAASTLTHRAAVKIKTLVRAVKRACDESDAVAAEAALIAWAQVHWPQYRITNLAQLKQALGSGELAQACEQLLAARYAAVSAQHDAWSGRALWNAFDAYSKAQSVAARDSKTSGLPPLYPQ